MFVLFYFVGNLCIKSYCICQSFSY